MRDQFSMFDLWNCAGSTNATSSPGSAGGHTHCVSPDGLMTARCGPEAPPCQPFSAAGKQLGRDDARHLGPHFVELVRACKPPVLFGEQVASSAVFGKAASGAKRAAASAPEWSWFDDLSDRLEAAHYAVGAGDIPAAGIGAPHILQRCFFGAVRLADADLGGEGMVGGRGDSLGIWGTRDAWSGHRSSDADGGLADADDARSQGRGGMPERSGECSSGARGVEGGLADASSERRDRLDALLRQGQVDLPEITRRGEAGKRTDTPHSQWANPDWLFCRDGKWRPAESSIFGVADGIPGELVRSGAYVPASSPLSPRQAGIDRHAPGARRVMRLRGYGNAIVPQAAAEFVVAFCDASRLVQ